MKSAVGSVCFLQCHLLASKTYLAVWIYLVICYGPNQRCTKLIANKVPRIQYECRGKPQTNPQSGASDQAKPTDLIAVLSHYQDCHRTSWSEASSTQLSVSYPLVPQYLLAISVPTGVHGSGGRCRSPSPYHATCPPSRCRADGCADVLHTIRPTRARVRRLNMPGRLLRWCRVEAPLATLGHEIGCFNTPLWKCRSGK